LSGKGVDLRTGVNRANVWALHPHLLRPQGAETPNTLPLSVIAEQMQLFGLGVDVDVIAQGHRTAPPATATVSSTPRCSLIGPRPGNAPPCW
jgi:hypothetical protein